VNSFGAVTGVLAVGISAVVGLCGCESTVSGTALRARSATPRDVAPLTESQLDQVLLPIGELNHLVGATKMTFVHRAETMSDNSTAVSDPDCLGSLFGAEQDVYDTYHWTAVRDEVAREPGSGNDHWVEQTVVLYPAAEDARKMFADSTSNWEQCGGSAVASASSDSSHIWEIGDVDVKDDLITQVIMQEESGGWECQHALSPVSNVTIETWACANGINDEAVDVAQELIANAAKK
jgi:PknH-like extracellular domain